MITSGIFISPRHFSPPRRLFLDADNTKYQQYHLMPVGFILSRRARDFNELHASRDYAMALVAPSLADYIIIGPRCQEM